MHEHHREWAKGTFLHILICMHPYACAHRDRFRPPFDEFKQEIHFVTSDMSHQSHIDILICVCVKTFQSSRVIQTCE